MSSLKSIDEKMVIFIKSFYNASLINISLRPGSTMSKKKAVQELVMKWDVDLFWKIFQDENTSQERVKIAAMNALITLVKDSAELDRAKYFLMSWENLIKAQTIFKSMEFIKMILMSSMRVDSRQ
jgi:hypothetical protein